MNNAWRMNGVATTLPFSFSLRGLFDTKQFCSTADTVLMFSLRASS
jgi:hypothetical protein